MAPKKDPEKEKNKSELQLQIIDPGMEFFASATHLVQKCTKPDRKEFLQIFRATCVGFLIMGFVGFFVKLVHIPINNILVGGS
mmetsp:Transcript_25437/g.50755  ORF Transcript_25437/g.50755 Transcript_25437/m.50755 type:complete len:83 (+) Transcript_25437:181-429(+)|eukprot:CAMPEP_0182458196 /NCGR_PEP_ID=MMETSP1319-20130603/3586_1 /TAXON_ID=172717 /ORGANISM="Bolidomonas pacifica, Strain RCC208" /LENGTH=82 /DNA_ID=CAMNT_0024656833 /DNA_START=414 /DNA_END=662 /DNA_ORIENTATION=+